MVATGIVAVVLSDAFHLDGRTLLDSTRRRRVCLKDNHKTWWRHQVRKIGRFILTEAGALNIGSTDRKAEPNDLAKTKIIVRTVVMLASFAAAQLLEIQV